MTRTRNKSVNEPSANGFFWAMLGTGQSLVEGISTVSTPVVRED
jgi:hypothetical protein